MAGAVSKAQAGYVMVITDSQQACRNYLTGHISSSSIQGSSNSFSAPLHPNNMDSKTRLPPREAGGSCRCRHILFLVFSSRVDSVVLPLACYTQNSLPLHTQLLPLSSTSLTTPGLGADSTPKHTLTPPILYRISPTQYPYNSLSFPAPRTTLCWNTPTSQRPFLLRPRSSRSAN